MGNRTFGATGPCPPRLRVTVTFGALRADTGGRGAAFCVPGIGDSQPAGVRARVEIVDGCAQERAQAESRKADPTVLRPFEQVGGNSLVRREELISRKQFAPHARQLDFAMPSGSWYKQQEEKAANPARRFAATAHPNHDRERRRASRPSAPKPVSAQTEGSGTTESPKLSTLKSVPGSGF